MSKPYYQQGVRMARPAINMAHNMTNHRPSDEDIAVIEGMRADFINLAEEVQALTPESREQSIALTKLEEALMWAVAAIARNNS